MNERFQELASQAGWGPTSDPYVRQAFNVKMFAELIVRECAGVALEQKKWVEEQEVFNAQDEQWNRARIQQSQRIADKIKQHFGVEE